MRPRFLLCYIVIIYLNHYQNSNNGDYDMSDSTMKFKCHVSIIHISAQYRAWQQKGRTLIRPQTNNRLSKSRPREELWGIFY